MGKKKILSVDDDPVILKLLERDLKKAGYKVVQSQAGHDAVRLARHEEPDLIILDVMIPDMDGGSVSQILRDNPITSNIPIIYLTSLITKKEEEKLRSEEAIYIAKPYDHDELLQKIKELLS